VGRAVGLDGLAQKTGDVILPDHLIKDLRAVFPGQN
jgi:hypothetical protein